MKPHLRNDWTLLLILIALVTVIALPILTYPLGRDQGEFATIGRGILDGRVPYRDLWNPKPPAVFYVYALAMSLLGRTTVALRAIDLFIMPLMMAALFWLGRRIAGCWVGFWSALLFAFFYYTETFWTLTQNDGIALLPMTLAVLCTFKAASHQRENEQTGEVISTGNWGLATNYLWPFLAGVLGAYVVWYKYPFALFLAFLPAAYLILRAADRRSKPTTGSWQLVVPLAFLLGVLLVLGGGALYLMSIGAWDDLLQSAQVTSQYTALTFNLADFGGLLVTALGFRWRQWGLLWVLAALWFIIPRSRALKTGATDAQTGTPDSPSLRVLGFEVNTHWLVMWLWLLVGLLNMLVQAKAYDYHWLPMLPPLALIAAASITRLITWLSTRLETFTGNWQLATNHLALGILFLALLAFLLWSPALPYLTGREDQVTYYNRFVSGAAEEFTAGQSLQVANLLRERVVPGDSLFIWGFRPEVYYMSGLNPATRFIFQFPLVGSWYPPEWREEAVETLWAAMPPYALVLQVDYMPWVTGSDADSNTLLQEYTEMNNWLIANYERDSQIGNFFIWRRKP
jgi:4-amino-4-deoxy-L-arabinose transferase-like glycosyltransferase